MVDAVERIHMMNNFFQQFNKNPDKDQQLVNFFLTELQEYSNREIQQGINMLIQSGSNSYLPKVWELKNHIDALTEKSEPKSVPCFICNSFGWVFNVIGHNMGQFIKPMSLKCKPVKGYEYKSTIAGRCKCLNGQRLGSGSPEVEPLADIKAQARKEEMDCVWVADRWADRLNGVPEVEPSPAIIESVYKLIKQNNNQGVIDDRKKQEGLFI